ncbi:multiple sugar transport system substrate-binding protein [Pullulanibacillus pueri]|uniref:Putative ABC transporter substrate-binding protein YesO n=1 Tax=Pullulanibacillus pueri TaxID=1437324 RepID=A0A8J2ZWJ8_9BACL|nr:sugar ABC transporter substrate-binding protein [Pullulanibacillus pueri]MBM7682595.1 multiple sugar transport system substrate-binding protein [Pullulanibacillus pueri]GGH82441.1 putative ABC transporter substrate-binding protein YesO [Pullulanibacillus pueri]
MLKHKVVYVFLLIMLAFGLMGCSNNSNGNASGENSKKVTIRFGWWGDPPRNKVYNAIIAEFEKEHPDIKVKGEALSRGDYWDKMATEIAGGNAPDIIGMHQTFVSDYARRNTLLSLDKYINSGVINLDDFPDSVKASSKVGNTTYMVAQGVTMSGQIYNASLLKELGVSTPDMDWSWDDFSDKALEIKKAFEAKGEGKGHWGVSDQSNNFQPLFQYYVREKGNQLYTEDGKIAFTEQNVIDWFTMWDKLRKEGAIPDAATSDEYANVSLEQSLIVKGKVAISGLPANQLYLYQQQMKDQKVEMIRQPTLEGKGGELIEGAYLSISAESKHPKEAAEFINFFVNNERAGKIFKVEQGNPGSTKIAKLIEPSLEPAQQSAMKFIEDTLQTATKAPYPPKGNTEITTAFEDAASSIAFGKASIKEASDTFMKKAKSILNQ